MSVNKIDVKNKVLQAGEHYVTSDYKSRNNDRQNHNGIDLVGINKYADYVVAIDDGEVITNKYSSSAGYYVEIRHYNNYISRYLHMAKGTIIANKNDKIKKGDIIGYMGTSGNSTGVHLHFSVYDSNGIPQDPLPYLLNTMNFQSNIYQNFVINVQTVLGVTIDGIAGTNTLNNTITISSNTNNRHMLVKHIQQYLYDLGYSEIGKIDGIAGTKFTKAIKNFQRDNDCVVDGIITKQNKTWKKLLKLL